MERFHGEFVERQSSTFPRHLVPKCRELSTWAASFEHVSSFLGDKFSILGKLSTNTSGARRPLQSAEDFHGRRHYLLFLPPFYPRHDVKDDWTLVVTSYHISYFFFFFTYCWQKATLKANTCYYSFRIFAGAPLYWETFLPVSPPNLSGKLSTLAKIFIQSKYIVLWIIILIRNRFRKSS